MKTALLKLRDLIQSRQLARAGLSMSSSPVAEASALPEPEPPVAPEPEAPAEETQPKRKRYYKKKKA